MRIIPLLILAPIVLCGASPLAGDQIWPSVDLICEVEAVELRAYWRPQTAIVERKMCEMVADHLQRDTFLRHWEFQIGDSKSVWALRLSLRGGGDRGETRLWLELQTPKNNKDWFHIWRRPGDLGVRPDPNAQRAPENLFEFFTLLLKKARAELEREFIKDIPIGNGGSVLPPDGNIAVRVLSWLPWNRFNRLRDSRFNVFCQHKERGGAILHSKGHSQPFDYEERGKVVLLQVVKYSLAGGPSNQPAKGIDAIEAQKFQPGYIYLNEYIETEWEVY